MIILIVFEGSKRFVKERIRSAYIACPPATMAETSWILRPVTRSTSQKSRLLSVPHPAFAAIMAGTFEIELFSETPIGAKTPIGNGTVFPYPAIVAGESDCLLIHNLAHSRKTRLVSVGTKAFTSRRPEGCSGKRNPKLESVAHSHSRTAYAPRRLPRLHTNARFDKCEVGSWSRET